MEIAYTLKNPIKVNNEEVKEIKFDFEQLTVEDFCRASAKKVKSMDGTLTLQECDSALHLYITFYAILRCNPTFDIMDLERIKGVDLMRLSQIGRNFTLDLQG